LEIKKHISWQLKLKVSKCHLVSLVILIKTNTTNKVDKFSASEEVKFNWNPAVICGKF